MGIIVPQRAAGIRGGRSDGPAPARGRPHHRAWRSLGLDEPELITARGPDRRLRETRESVEQRWRERTARTLYLETPPLVVAVLLFGGAALALGRSHRRTGSRMHLALCLAFALPAALAGAHLVFSLGGALLSRPAGP